MFFFLNIKSILEIFERKLPCYDVAEDPYYEVMQRPFLSNWQKMLHQLQGAIENAQYTTWLNIYSIGSSPHIHRSMISDFTYLKNRWDLFLRTH